MARQIAVKVVGEADCCKGTEGFVGGHPGVCAAHPDRPLNACQESDGIIFPLAHRTHTHQQMRSKCCLPNQRPGLSSEFCNWHRSRASDSSTTSKTVNYFRRVSSLAACREPNASYSQYKIPETGIRSRSSVSFYLCLVSKQPFTISPEVAYLSLL